MTRYQLRRHTVETLVELSQEGIHEALSLVVEKYYPMVVHLARQYYGSWAEESDIIQNGCVGLLKAVYYFKEGKDTHFNTFAWTSIDSEIKTFLTYLNRKKNRVLSESFSYDYFDSSQGGDDEEEDMGFFETHTTSVLGDEEIERKYLISKSLPQLYERLTDEEKRVFDLYLLHCTYQEMADQTGLKVKRIDNIIQKCKKKFKEIFEEEIQFIHHLDEWLRGNS